MFLRWGYPPSRTPLSRPGAAPSPPIRAARALSWWRAVAQRWAAVLTSVRCRSTTTVRWSRPRLSVSSRGFVLAWSLRRFAGMAEGTPVRNGRASHSRNTATSREWPCVFNGDFIREQIDPRVKEEWTAHRTDKPKFGDLRNTFRREHCRAVNPWGSETCPFREEDCAIAFWKAVAESLGARNAHGYFIRVARTSGALRADMAVARRADDARMRTHAATRAPEARPVGGPDRPGVPTRSEAGMAEDGSPPAEGAAESGSGEGGVRRPLSRPRLIGDLLREADLRSRPRPGQERDGDEGR